MPDEDITEHRARVLLAQVGSAAQDATRYAAHRYAEGWVFSWSSSEIELPMGEAPWIVTVSGVAKRVPVGWDAVPFLRATASGSGA